MRIPVLVACGLAAALAARSLTAPPPGPIPRHNPTVDPAVTEEDVLTEWDDSLRDRVERRPWIDFQEPPYHGKRLNIDRDELGWTCRRTVPANEGAARSVWCFGDSCVFGDWLADEQTIPSAIARATGHRVVNHAHCGHTSAQACALLESLLREGRRADLVVLFSTENEGAREDRSVFDPVANRLEPTGAPPFPTAEDAARRWQASWALFASAARTFGIRSLVVVLPMPYADDRLDRWRRIPEVLTKATRDRARAERALLLVPEGGLDLRDGFDRFQGQPIVDSGHFTATFSKWVGERVAEESRNILK